MSSTFAKATQADHVLTRDEDDLPPGSPLPLPGAPHHHLAHDGDFRPEEAAWEPHVTALAKSVSTNSRDQSRYSAIVDPALKLMIDAVQRYDG